MLASKGAKIEELRRAIIKAYLVKERNKIITEEYKNDTAEVSRKIEKLMGELEINKHEFIVDSSNSGANTFASKPMVLSCSKVSPKSIEYNAKMIYDRVGKDIGNQLVSKKYVVSDIDGLIQMLKSHGVKPKEFKRFIRVEMTLNESKLNQIYDTGVIKMEDLQGCYKVKTNKSYWSIKAKPVRRD